MTENPYRVWGPSTPRLLGRVEILRRIRRLLTPPPQHVSVVGPAHYGKSVLLSHLANKYRTGSNGYLTAVHIDLRHDTPGSDSAFKRRLAEETMRVLQPCRPDFSKFMDSELVDADDEAVLDLLRYVFRDELKGENERILVVLDGFDCLLAGPGITRNLWGQLRTLAQQPSLRFLTGSRRRLRELCKTEESRASFFWNIFYDTPVEVGALNDSDWDFFFEPLQLTGCKLDNSARKKIANWTGGVPLLVCALLRELWEKHRGACLSKPEIDRAAETILDRRWETLAALWDACNVELRADLGTLASADIRRAEMSDKRYRTLLSRGFGRESSKKIRGSCRLIQRYAEGQAPALTDLKRLFGAASDFETHIGSLLELRLKQVAGGHVDGLLHDFVSRAVREIGKPELAINGIRGIVNRALGLIWEKELAPGNRLPTAWIDEWKYRGLRNLPENQGGLPPDRGKQCRVLRLITGSYGVPRQSRYVTKTTSLLVDHLNSVGNFAQHREEYAETEVSVGFTVAIVLAAISLVDNLTADLQRGGDSGHSAV